MLVASFGTTRLTQGTKSAVVSWPSNLEVLIHEVGDNCEGDRFIATNTGAFNQPGSLRDLSATVLVD